MIAFLEGEVKFVEADAVVLMIGGLGYRVHLVGTPAQVGTTLSLHIYQHIREDRNDLYGFPSKDYQHLFLKVIDISGVGTKLAQKLLNAAAPEQVMARIAAGDIDFLVSIPGVGKKTAQKIILELKGVLVDQTEQPAEDRDTLEALLSLGYSKQDCQEVLPLLTEATAEGRVRQALKLLLRT